MVNPTGEQIALPTDPAELPAAFEQAFNSGSIEGIRQLFDPQAVRVLSPGHAQSGEQMWKAAAETLPERLPVKLSVRHIYTAGDTALMICDYVHEGTGPDGKHLRLEGTAADILRRGSDGVWRCLISNPPGTSRA